MNDKDFDKLLKMKVNQNEEMPDEINKIFSNFEEEIMMENSSKKINISYILRYAAVVVLGVMICGVGGTTYAHINGEETFLSPMLRKLGINSKYEENAVIINEVKEEENLSVELLDVAVDDTTLIVGYKIKVNDGKNPILLEKTTSINDMLVHEISHSLKKIAENEYVYYEVFNAGDISLNNNEEIEFNTEIYAISEYTMDYSEALGEYEKIEKRHECSFKFDKKLQINNVSNTQKYTFENNYEKESKGIVYSVKEFVKGSYANILKVSIDRTNSEYVNAIENDYTVYDSNGNIIARAVEEERMFEELEIKDKIILGNTNSGKIKLEIKVKDFDDSFLETITFDIDLSDAKEVKEEPVEYKEHEELGFKFKYDSKWNYIGRYDFIDEKNPEREYFIFGIPSTTDLENEFNIWFEISYNYDSLQEYIDEFNSNLHISPGEWQDKIEEGKCDFLGTEGYYFVTEMAEGYTYYNEVYVTYIDGTIYEINFGGEEKEYYNLKDTLREFVSNVELTK